MSSIIVVTVYGASTALALLLLYFFGPAHWHWHAASILLAVAIGFSPTPAGWASPAFDLFVGFLFLFFFLWGAMAPLFRTHHHHHHHHGEAL